MQRLINWWDKYALKWGVLFLLLFIPLYPKFPLFDIVHTWVYIRLEDILIVLLVGIFAVETLRKKTTIRSPLTFPIVLYWVIGALVTIHGLLFIVGNVPNIFSHLMLLHYLRRIEYMVVFFIALSSIKSMKDVYDYSKAFVLMYVLVVIYGFGQKYMQFPAFLTMNEEFAKGIPLYLALDGRVASTFAGHYDLAGFLVFALAILGSFFLGMSEKTKRIGLAVISVLGLALLVFTKSRVSFAAFIASIILLFVLHKKKWLIVPLLIGGIVLVFSYGGLSERFGKTFRIEPVVYQLPQERPIATLKDFTRPPESDNPLVTPTPYEELPLGSGFLDIPLVNNMGEPPYMQDLPDYNDATSSAVIVPINTYLIKQTVVYDISFTTRTQGQWPKAIEAFRRNVLFGSGYSSLSIASDSDYFRMLGETGIVGTVSFLSIFACFFLCVKRYLTHEKDAFARSFAIGVSAGLAGLFVNAFFIDIFEASKIAYIVWLTMGAVLAMIVLRTKNTSLPVKEFIAVVKNTRFLVVTLIVVSLALFYSSLSHFFSGDDFTWLRWATETRPQDILRYFVDSDKFFYRPLTKTVFYYLYQMFGIKQPIFYHLVVMTFHILSAFFVFKIVNIISKKWMIAYVSALLFLIHPIHAENIFWISGLSSVMSGCLFLGSFYTQLLYDISKLKYRLVFHLASLLLFALSLSSYEMSMTVPGLLFMYYLTKFHLPKKSSLVTNLQSFVHEVIAPISLHGVVLALYLFIRNSVADSYWMQGDYDVNIAKLPFNVLGNSIGYVAELLVGFSAISWYDSMRGYLRENIIVALFAGIILVAIVVWIVRMLKINKQTIAPDILLYAGWFVITLVPALGLGNIAERYLYIPSVGGIALISLLIYKLWSFSPKWKIVSVVLLVSIMYMYTSQLLHAKETWRQASSISYTIVSSVTSMHETLPQQSKLYFVNMPLRVERAWIFPVGLSDALWLMYRDNSLTVETGLDRDSAMREARNQPNSFLFLFEDNRLHEVPIEPEKSS